MKKIPLHTIIFFYLSLIPMVFAVSIGGIFSVFLLPTVFMYIFQDINAMILTPVIIFLQICAIVNYIDAYKQVHSYNCELYNKNKIPLWTVKFFYFSIVMMILFFMMCGFTLYEGADLKYVIFSPEALILVTVAVLSIRNYLKVRKNKSIYKDKE
ncbi:MAG: hypothetical protein NC205_00035 [Prevotella sp.]|nr:hypothetical protein [Alistipes senegalensis]MCM1356952.1 hypothetical protein [Prevotella sp.]